jgi:hypothetical protein
MKKVLILGTDKLNCGDSNFIKDWSDEIWVCNKTYELFKYLPRLNLVAAVNEENARLAYKYRIENNLKYRIITSNQLDIPVEKFKKYIGYKTIIECIHQALLENYDVIYLLGINLSNDQSCFMNQYNNLIKEYGSERIVVIKHTNKEPIEEKEYDKRKTILQYHKTKIANVPEIIANCITKYSKKYKSIEGSDVNVRCDLIHFHNKYAQTNKPSIIQYHSEPHITMTKFPNSKYCIPQYPALFKEYGNFELVRNIIDLDLPEYEYKEVKDKIVVSYTPSTIIKISKYADKGFVETLPILEKLKKEFPDKFDFNFVHNKPLSEAIDAKVNSNIVIDECISGSYHRCTLEGLAMGKLSIVYVQPEIEELFKQVSNTNDIPYKNINISNLENYLRFLIDKGIDYVLEEGKKSYNWMRKYWHHLDIIKEYEEIYDNNLSCSSEFDNLIKNKRVCFVCPSKILENKDLGNFINNFDVVIRTNNFFPVDKKLQKDYGKKCEVLYVNVQFTREMSPFPIKKYKQHGIKFICSKTGNFNGYDKEYEKHVNLRNISNVVAEIHKEINGPLQGSIIIKDILNHNPSELCILGMTFYDGNVLDWENQYISGYIPSKILDEALKKREEGFFKNKPTHDLDSNKEYTLKLYNEGKLYFDDVTKEYLGL